MATTPRIRTKTTPDRDTAYITIGDEYVWRIDVPHGMLHVAVRRARAKLALMRHFSAKIIR